MNESPSITGSAGTQTAGDVNQPMPSALNDSTPAQGRFVPPADIGGGGTYASTAPMASPPANSSNVQTQDLPALPQSTSGGSPQAMPAQPNVTPLFSDESTPKTAPQPAVQPQSAPNLSVVPENSFQHTIEPGESLYAIARRYDVSTDALVQANTLEAPDQIYVGQKLIIPGRADLMASRPNAQQTQAQESAEAAPVPAAAPEQKQSAPVHIAAVNEPKVSGAGNFRWPVQGRVIVDFPTSHDTGINIEAPEGAPVRAAENGTVIYTGDGIEGYGNLVLVRHSNGYVTAYAHLKSIDVAKDDVIDRGDELGTVGMTGSVSRPQLHFELRQGASPVNPVPMLAG